MIALANDNQWTVEWHTWLPYKTNQFHVQYDFLFSSERPVLVREWPKNIFVSAVKFLLLSKSVINEKYLDNYKKQNNLRKNPCCVGSLLQYACIRSQYKVNLSNDKAELYEKTVNSKLK